MNVQAIYNWILEAQNLSIEHGLAKGYFMIDKSEWIEWAKTGIEPLLAVQAEIEKLGAQ